ncbi:hypothetical protein J6W32_02565 [bacterium]|nr:hypothetical protein [bacterium]
MLSKLANLVKSCSVVADVPEDSIALKALFAIVWVSVGSALISSLILLSRAFISAASVLVLEELELEDEVGFELEELEELELDEEEEGKESLIFNDWVLKVVTKLAFGLVIWEVDLINALLLSTAYPQILVLSKYLPQSLPVIEYNCESIQLYGPLVAGVAIHLLLVGLVLSLSLIV